MTGEFTTLHSHWQYLSGVFSQGEKDTGAQTAPYDNKSIVFNASDGNALYSGDKLQVSALSVLTCIKL